jgi:HlyD family secretion protein
VNGTVISRSVDVGQTVAASFQTPTLFTIAEDLAKMNIDTNVDEADISRTNVGQEVRFTVDAYPDMSFTGTVSEIRNAATVVSNVVTYNVVVRVDNKDLKLKPGMTANVSIITAKKEKVLLVPNSALRFRPKDAGSTGTGTALKKQGKGGKGQGIWVLEDGRPVRKEIRTGINDGSFTEVVSGLQEGMNVITAQDGLTDQTKQSSGSSPRPRLFR